MPIIASEIQVRLSGGASNTNPNASIGGIKSSTSVNTATPLHNLFDEVSGAESSAGDVEYRCLYIHNNNATLTFRNPVIFISANTPLSQSQIAIGIGASATNGTETAVANEGTAPASVTFSEPSSEGAALSLGDIPAGQHRAVWVRRTITAGAPATNADGATLRIVGDTAA